MRGAHTFSYLVTLSAMLLMAPLRVVSTAPWIDAIVSEIAGDRVERQLLVQAGYDPHTVPARPSMISSVRRADLLVINGLDYEVSFLSPLLESSANPRITPGRDGYLDLSRFIIPQEVPMGKVDRSKGDIHPFGNPHYFSDPENIVPVARGLAERLSLVDPAGASYYNGRLTKFLESWDTRKTRWKQKMAPLRGKGVVLYHRSLTYFLQAFEMKLAGTIEPLPGISPSPRSVAQLTSYLKQNPGEVACILQEPWYEKRSAQTLSETTGIGVRFTPEEEWDGKPEALVRWFEVLTTRLVECSESSNKTRRKNA
ncbi:MAG: metal ABC transporter substrate-binding protein [bacterium JZ-2024 1]